MATGSPVSAQLKALKSEMHLSRVYSMGALRTNISARVVLKDIGMQAGVDGAETDAWLDFDADADAVDKETFLVQVCQHLLFSA
ncbi:hypothetical protein F4819DRAFT_447964 [Hypoxylon fuscum]|nr:hypothetical protein F4819DRAFT_447964 [Hypoxylon fuscum]